MTPMLGIMASQISGHLTPPSSYESIATYNPTSGQSVTFSSIPSTFKSLQVRILYLTSGADNINYRLNGDTGTNYAVHYLFAAGSETPYANGYTSPFDTKGSLNAVSNIAVASPYPTVLVVDFIDRLVILIAEADVEGQVGTELVVVLDEVGIAPGAAAAAICIPCKPLPGAIMVATLKPIIDATAMLTV